MIAKEPDRRNVAGECHCPRGGRHESMPKRAEIAPGGFLGHSFSEEWEPASGRWRGQVRLREGGILREGSLERLESSIGRESE